MEVIIGPCAHHCLTPGLGTSRDARHAMAIDDAAGEAVFAAHYRQTSANPPPWQRREL
jgi:hypothetical protein